MVRRLHDQDEQALGELYDRHGELIYSLARSILGNSPDAEEVVADTFMRLWSNPSIYEPKRGSLRTLLSVIARNRALDSKRSGTRREAAVTKAAASHSQGLGTSMGTFGGRPDQEAERTELRSMLDGALSTLSDPQRIVLELAYFGGLSQSEIALHVDAPLGTVKTRMRSAMHTLRECLSSLHTGAV